MGTRIQDTLALADKFRDKINDLKAIAEAFRHGDLLVKNYNNFLADMKSAIDSGDESTYTKEDFDDLLDMRNELFGPIMENMAFIQQFERYNPAIPVVIPEIDELSEVLGDKYYDEINNVYTYHVIQKVFILQDEQVRLFSELDKMGEDITNLQKKVEVLTTTSFPVELANEIKNFYATSKQEITLLTDETVKTYRLNETDYSSIIIQLKALL